ncbi:MAG: hypothetical protein U0974_03005 [Gemmatimonadales bacterium]|nr:hypothetical protein [Gemmatimonadales bacterium]MDZ4388683.1 hypothetical protein [Gemmatimonadales bacterium]
MKRVALAALVSMAACGGGAEGPDPAAEAAAAAARADSIAAAAVASAPAFRDSAQARLATLLDDPATATFDSVIVVQPPEVEGRLPARAVCGRMGGRPGVGGSRTPVRFIYISAFTVFVEEDANRAKFADLWAKSCGAVGGVVQIGER